MASNSFSHWEVDPFFSAAEEVQNSADRMESMFRSWRRWKESPELAAVDYVEACRQDLVIAVDTVKWQLEEFERAVQLQTLKEPLYLHKASSRHHQFVKAIKQHVSFIEKELWPTESHYKLRLLNTDSKVKENDHLAEFLSGSRVGGYKMMNDNQITLLENKEQTIAVLNSNVRAVSCLEAGDGDLPMPATTPTLRGKKLFEYCDVSGRQNHATLDREEICPPEMEPECINGRLYTTEGRINGLLLTKRYDCEGMVHCNASPANETLANTEDHVADLQVPESLGNGLGFWGLWKGKKGSAWLQLSDSGFKRWKDGDANLADQLENATSLVTVPLPKVFCTNDLEQGYNNRTGNHRKSCSSIASEVDCFEIKHLNGGWEPVQLPIRTQHSCSCGSILPLVLGVLIILAFVSIYFWFLSTIIPTEIDAVVPGHFPS